MKNTTTAPTAVQRWMVMGMYKSPVSIMETAVRKIVEERDNEIFYKIQSALGVDVDRGELMRALQYDRNQYKKGYADGKADAMAEIVRCKDCEMFCPEEIRKLYNTDKYCMKTGWVANDDDFCSYGKRKGDGNA